MSRRSRMGRQRRWSPRRAAREFFAGIGQRKRKAFSFEQLEDRCYFSVSQALNLQFESLSSDTAEGALALWQRELDWATMASSSGTASSQARYTTQALPTDPLFASQWHLLNTGQEVGTPDFQPLFAVAGEDINVVPAWNLGYTGAGISVAVLDTGVQLTHPDLIANIDASRRFNAISGSANPSPNLLDPVAGHGTSVAGLIGASENNGMGGTGVAPGISIVPIRVGIGTLDLLAPVNQFANAFQYVLQNDVDVTNNSWGPDHSTSRAAIPLTPEEAQILRDSVIFGRDGLGIIHVFSSGNDAGPFLSPGFQSFGNYDSASYDPWVNSRYTIGVTGVDHDGGYGNADGSFTSYANAGASVLVAAPTGSNVAQNVADDSGQGSGIWTTDLVGDFGFNAIPLPSGFDPDRDPLADPNFTQRFNGTSAAAPIATGVIALMLEANPSLTFRDVQEILVRSARQNSQFETATSGALGGARPVWQTNQMGPFRDPDPWDFFAPPNPFNAVFFPLADPSILALPLNLYATDTNDGGRQFGNHYESQPALFTNGAGYSVSQGFGVYAEQYGYAHGVIDAGLAVKMALQWDALKQNIFPNTEKTYSTFAINFGGGLNLPAAEKMDNDLGGLLIPGGIGGLDGFADYWNEYFADDDPADPDDGPFSGDDPPVNSRGLSYLDFAVPPTEAMNVEWVEVKVDINGPADDLDSLRIMLTSPEGTQSEFMQFYSDLDFGTPLSYQDLAIPGLTRESIWRVDPIGDIDVDGGNFVWTFSTNRSWGESTNTAVVIDPVTGEPSVVTDPFSGLPLGPVFRNWEVHIENWSNSDYALQGLEVVWHGKPIEGGATDQNWSVAKAQRVQGFVGIDTNSDENFNFDRTNQTIFDSDGDPLTTRLGDVTRQLDYIDNNLNGSYDTGDTINQEPFAANILVEAYRVDPTTGDVDDTATARFLTGADGNYYFDLDPNFEYEIRATDPQERIFLEDPNTPAQYLKHFKTSWRITPDWFYAPNRDNPLLLGNEPGEIFFGTSDANGDGIITDSPDPFLDVGIPVPMAVKNINFLIKQDAPPQEIVVNGTVFADLNGNGLFDGDDTAAGGVTIYFDANRNGVHDASEQTEVSSEDETTRGQYSITIPAALLNTYSIGVDRPTSNWAFTNPADGTLDIFAGPGDILDGNNFFLDPPDEAFPPDGTTEPGNILGVVFNDRNNNGARNAGEEGIAGFRVFIDANQNGLFDAGEAESITSGNGTYFFADVAPGVHRINMEEGNAWQVISPALGYREVALGPGGTVSGQLTQFALRNLADRDWGDLPVSYNTLGVTGGPNHFVVIGANGAPGFYLGARIDGEVDGKPTADATGDDAIGQDDDGVVILTNGGELQPGANTLQVTVAGVGGILNGWIDWNSNGQFDASEHLEFQYALGTSTQADLNPGTHQLTITAPSDLAGGPLAARFRWGEAGLGPTGPAQFGEVEDYILASSVPAALVGDYDSNGVVNTDDLLLWNATFGSTTDLRADGSRNGEVDIADYVIWRKAYMDAQAAGGSSVASGSGSASTSTAGSASQPGTSSGLSQVLTPDRGWALDSAPPELLARIQNSKLWPQIQALGYIPRSFGLTPQVAQGGSLGSTGSSGAVVYGPSAAPTAAPTVAPPAIDNSATTGELGAVAGPADVVIVSTTRPSYRPESGRFVSASVAVVAVSDNSLLLVDQALADFNDDSDDVGDDSLVGYVRTVDQDERVCDMALAAVLEDEASWWSSI